MTNKPLIAFGDSITTGIGASAPANAYIQILKTSLGVALTNFAHTGDMAADQAWQLYSATPDPNKDTTVMLGAGRS